MPTVDTRTLSIFSPVHSAAPTLQGASGGSGFQGAWGAGDPPPLRPAWRLACGPDIYQLCRGPESPHSSAKGVDVVVGQGQDWGWRGRDMALLAHLGVI